MAIRTQYRSRETGNISYLMFFIDGEHPDYVDVVCVIYSDDADPDWAWTLWTFQVRADEIDDVSHCMEVGDNKYETEGFSETFGDLEPLFDSIREMGYDEELSSMEAAAFSFFE